MKAQRRRRPQRREHIDPPQGTDLIRLAQKAHYVGSAEHKSYPWPAGPPRLRSDASRCDPHLGTMDQFTDWLRAEIVAGQFGAPWEGDFPRYVWHLQDDLCYEARLVNRGNGDYKGYPLTPAEAPEWL